MKDINIFLKKDNESLNVYRFSLSELEGFFKKVKKPILTMKKFFYVIVNMDNKELASISGEELVQYSGFSFKEKITNFLSNGVYGKLPVTEYFDPLSNEKASSEEYVCGCSQNSGCLGCKC